MLACCSSVTAMLVHCIVQELHRLISNKFFYEFSLHRHKFDCRIHTVSIHPKRLGRSIKHEKIEHEMRMVKKKRLDIFKRFQKRILGGFAVLLECCCIYNGIVSYNQAIKKEEKKKKNG